MAMQKEIKGLTKTIQESVPVSKDNNINGSRSVYTITNYKDGS